MTERPPLKPLKISAWNDG